MRSNKRMTRNKIYKLENDVRALNDKLRIEHQQRVTLHDILANHLSAHDALDVNVEKTSDENDAFTATVSFDVKIPSGMGLGNFEFANIGPDLDVTYDIGDYEFKSAATIKKKT